MITMDGKPYAWHPDMDVEQLLAYVDRPEQYAGIRLNGKPVLSTEELANGDLVRIGETTLKFVALCGEDFTWASSEGEGTAAE